MDSVAIEEVGIEAAALRAAATVEDDGVVLYPTDTLYGLGADAFSDAAVTRIFSIKGRANDKPLSAIVTDCAMAARYSDIDERVQKLIELLPRGKVSFVVKSNHTMQTGICRNAATFCFRIPDDEFCTALLRYCDRPIVATSANKSGAVCPQRIDAIIDQLGVDARGISLAVDAGVLPSRLPSTVIDCTRHSIRVLREGALRTADLMHVLRVIDARV